MIFLGKIVAVTNQKGGVGKTTTSVNLCACLAELGKKVLMVDLDPQGNASSGFGIDKAEVPKTVYDVLVAGYPADKTIVASEFGVDVIPASIDLAGAEVELVPTISREMKLKRALDPLRPAYDYIYIDCPPTLGLLTLNALTAADAILLPIQCEFYALEGVSQLIKTIEMVQVNLNPSLVIEGVLLTMYDSRVKLAVQVAEEVRKNFGGAAYWTMIPRNVRLSEAPSYGQPITVYDRKSKGAASYRELALEVISRDS